MTTRNKHIKEDLEREKGQLEREVKYNNEVMTDLTSRNNHLCVRIASLNNQIKHLAPEKIPTTGWRTCLKCASGVLTGIALCPACGEIAQTKGKYLVDIIESERGWGAMVDHTKVFDTLKEAEEFTKHYNERYNNKPEVPDWYMAAEIRR